MNLLDNLDLIKHLDTDDMYHKIIHMPEHILQAYNTPNIKYPKDFTPATNNIKRIVICGMGGSAIAADIIYALFNHLIPINISKDYNTPFIDENTLLIACSYSGDTEETLACVNSAIKNTKHIWAVTTGGKLKDIIDNKFPYLEITKGYPPRSAIAFLFFSVLKALEIEAIIPDQSKSVQKVAANLMMKAGAIAKSVPQINNLAKSSAEQINNKVPLFYSSNPLLAPVAYRFKCQINENAKYPAFFHTFPEMNHNEIEAWENMEHNAKFIPVFIRFFNENALYEKRLTVFKKILSDNHIDYLEFFADGDTDIAKLFSLIYLGDMISYYLAILNNTNPTTIKFINYLKQNI